MVRKAEVAKPTSEEIRTVIDQLDDSKAPGPTGIASRHLKYLAKECDGFVELLDTLFGMLMTCPQSCDSIPDLFSFETVFIPKKGKPGKYRPICCNEGILNVFHKCLLRKF